MPDARWRVLATDIAWPTPEVESAVLAAAGAELVLSPTGDPAELARLAVDADAILTCFATVTAEVLDAAPRCRTVARYGVGVDNIDVARATALGMVVSNVPVYCTDEVADSALVGILALARRLLPSPATSPPAAGAAPCRAAAPGCAARCSASSASAPSVRPWPCARRHSAWRSWR